MHRDDEENGTKYSSEHEQYFDGCERGMFASEDAAHCGCRGAGWFLSQVDTWHECPVHFDGQPHPEADEDFGDEAPERTSEGVAASETLTRRQAEETAADQAMAESGEIPF